jgi:hypothetical protein
MMRWSVSGEGGVGKSGGSWGKSADTSSGCAAKSGVKFDGVRMSDKERSMINVMFKL